MFLLEFLESDLEYNTDFRLLPSRVPFVLLSFRALPGGTSYTGISIPAPYSTNVTRCQAVCCGGLNDGSSDYVQYRCMKIYIVTENMFILPS